MGTHALADTVEVKFNRDVRPILSKNCFACHGPDPQTREGGFRLDVRDSAIAEADSGERPIMPGDTEASELLRRIETTEEGEVMPPDPHDPLATAEIDTLTRWIAQGAVYENHWSFDPPRPVAPPAVTLANWPRNPIDRFILARLEHEGLAPAPEVNRETLIRRVTLDLTGLPPTPAEVDAFLGDTQAGAYDRAVDRLINTIAYAERRAQDWLDLARYADTRGFADDGMRQIWPYRDWVIRAINRNQPFDQFTIEQLAGDMLPHATNEQRLATAFHRNAPQARGLTYPVEEYRLKGVVDRVNTTGRVWLGLTMGCAECHDHKFDPITQHDYYSMCAIFNNVEHGGSGLEQGGPTMQYHPPPMASAEAIAQHARVETEREKVAAELIAVRELIPSGAPLEHENLLGNWDQPTLVADPAEFNVTGDFTITARIRTTQSVADIVSKYDWRGRQRSYVFGIGGEGELIDTAGHLFCWVSSQADPFAGVEVISSFKINDGFEHDVAVVFEAGKSLRLFVDGVEDKAARVIGNVPESVAISDRRLAIGAGYEGTPEANAFRFEGNLTEVRLFGAALDDQIRQRKSDPKVAKLQATLAKLDAKIADDTAAVVSAPVMRERLEPRETFIHIRGSFLNRGEQVFPAAPAMFSSAENEKSNNRSAFARWLVDDKNPLVARVAVNRFWQTYFGRGIVSTSDDFGAQGAMPTHPELLDWLATEFVTNGWDMKHMHRLIVTSATYRQSTRIATKSLDRDPQNLLLARISRVRLPAEQIRDQALAVSGLLVEKVGGPPVFPYQPEGYWQQRALPGKWINGTGDDLYRRTLYTYWRRMALNPSLEVLDAPARDLCVARRNISNVPTQALVLLNEPVFHDCAVALAARLRREIDGNEVAKLEHAFRLVLSRAPDDGERSQFLAYLAEQREQLSSELDAARQLAAMPESQDFVDQAAWTLVSGVLLNLDETITRP